MKLLRLVLIIPSFQIYLLFFLVVSSAVTFQPPLQFFSSIGNGYAVPPQQWSIPTSSVFNTSYMFIIHVNRLLYSVYLMESMHV